MAGGHQSSSNGSVWAANARLLIHDHEQLKRWKEPFTMVSNCITSGEVPLLINALTHLGMPQKSDQQREGRFPLSVLLYRSIDTL